MHFREIYTKQKKKKFIHIVMAFLDDDDHIGSPPFRFAQLTVQCCSWCCCCYILWFVAIGWLNGMQLCVYVCVLRMHNMYICLLSNCESKLYIFEDYWYIIIGNSHGVMCNLSNISIYILIYTQIRWAFGASSSPVATILHTSSHCSSVSSHAGCGKCAARFNRVHCPRHIMLSKMQR